MGRMMSRSPTITEGDDPVTSILPPVHPGEILREEYLIPFGMSAGALARKLGVPRTRIERVIAERTPVTPDTALRLAKFFRTSPERSEEHTSELQSLMRTSYAVFCLKKKQNHNHSP